MHKQRDAVFPEHIRKQMAERKKAKSAGKLDEWEAKRKEQRKKLRARQDAAKAREKEKRKDQRDERKRKEREAIRNYIQRKTKR